MHYTIMTLIIFFPSDEYFITLSINNIYLYKREDITQGLIGNLFIYNSKMFS